MDEFMFVDLVESFFKARGYITTREVTAGYGRADLVIGKLIGKHCQIRRNNKQSQPLLKENYFEVLRNLPDIDHGEQPIHMSKVIDSIAFSNKYTKNKIINYLEDHGYIKRCDEKYLFKVNGWLPMTSEVIAIEAKLYDWKRGILQANRYKSFADKVYLALPEKTAHLVDLDMLRDLNVGLYIYKNNKIVEKVKAKKTTKPIQDKRNYVSELLWDSSIGSLAC